LTFKSGIITHSLVPDEANITAVVCEC